MTNSKIIFSLILFCSACTKQEVQNGKFYYGKVEVSMAALPNSPSIDVFYDGKKMMELPPGYADRFITMASVSHKLAIYKAGTDTLIADTLITPVKSDTLFFKVGYSEDFGLHGFLGQSVAISPDSCMFQLYDNLPVQLQPDDVAVDVYLCKYNPSTDGFEETGIVFPNFEKRKLYPKVVTIPLYNADGTIATHALRFKNTATGEFILDEFMSPDLVLSPAGGKFLILTVGYRILRGRVRFGLTSTEM